MKLDYRCINFIRIGAENKKVVYGCYNKKHSEFCGLIQWYSPMNEYAYYINEKAAISAECLRELSDFTYQLNNQ